MNSHRAYFLILFVFISSALLSTATDIVVGTYDNQEIKISDIEEKLSKIPPMYQQQFKTIKGEKNLLETYSTELIYFSEGKKMKLDQDPEFLKIIETKSRPTLMKYFQENYLASKIAYSQDEIKEYYNRHKNAQFKINPYYKIFHIQVESDSSAQALLAELNAGNATLIDLMNKYSQNQSSRAHGGYTFKKTSNPFFDGIGYDSELDSIVVNAPLNKFMGPFTTKTGIHFFKVEEFKPQSLKKLADVKEQIKNRLKPQKTNKLSRDLLHETKKSKNIKILDIVLANTPWIIPGKIKENFNTPVVTTDDDRYIVTVKEVYDEINKLDPNLQESYKKEINQQKKIVNEILENKAQYFTAIDMGFNKKIESEQSYKDMFYLELIRFTYSKLVLENIKISEDDLKKYYDDNKDRYTINATRKYHHYTYPSKRIAKKVLKKLKKYDAKKDTARIEKLLAKYTEGDNKIIEKIKENTVLIPGFGVDSTYAEVIWNTPVGEYSSVFENRNGSYTFLKVLNHNDKTLRPFDTVSSSIQNMIRRQEVQKKFQSVTEKLKKTHNLKTYPERLISRYSATDLFSKASDAQQAKNFNEAIEYYDVISMKDTNSKDAAKALFMKGFLLSEELKDKDAAIATYEKLLKDFPNNENRDSIEMMLKELKGEINILDIINEEE